MKHYEEPYIMADKILIVFKNIGRMNTDTLTMNLGNNPSDFSKISLSLTTLINENYLKHSPEGTNYYEILGNGIQLIQNGGYKNKFEKDNKEELEDGISKWYESENARIQFENYPITKSNARLAILLSGISVLIAILSMILSKCK